MSMKPQTPFVSMDEMLEDHPGLTKLMIRFDVKSGYIPGEIDKRNRVVVRRGPYNEYLAGNWERPVQQEPAMPSKPVGIVSIGKAS